MNEHDQQAAEIGAKVRRARKARGWTIDDLAEVAGVAPNTANKVELGRKVRPGNLRSVIDAVGVESKSEPTEVDGGVQLAMDLVQKWLEALPPEERVKAVQDLTRFIMLSGQADGGLS